MQHIDLTLCNTIQEAIGKGFTKEDKYKDFTFITVEQATVVGQGTTAGNATVDIVLKDAQGNKYITMVTAELLKAITKLT